MPVEISKGITKTDRDEEDDDAAAYEAIPMEEDSAQAVWMKHSPNIDIRVTHQDVERYSATLGCPAFKHIVNTAKQTRAPQGNPQRAEGGSAI